MDNPESGLSEDPDNSHLNGPRDPPKNFLFGEAHSVLTFFASLQPGPTQSRLPWDYEAHQPIIAGFAQSHLVLGSITVVTTGDNGDDIRVLLYSYSTTRARGGGSPNV